MNTNLDKYKCEETNKQTDISNDEIFYLQLNQIMQFIISSQDKT